MTDDNGATAPPITVSESPAKALSWEAVKGTVIFVAGAGSMQAFHSEMVAGLAVAAATGAVAALPAIVTVLWAQWVALKNHLQKKTMAKALPDAVAKVVK